MSPGSSFKDSVDRYYTERLAKHGRGHLAVDWNSTESQILRFKELMYLADKDAFSVNDFGCGYGALVDYLEGRFEYAYCGYDISSAMIEEAKRTYAGRAGCGFTDKFSNLDEADYTIASGVFNVKLDAAVDAWETYVQESLDDMASVSSNGFAFNMLTSYADEDRKKAYLYYGNPSAWFDYCKRRFSPHVALLHDYPLYEFTILVRHQ